MIAWQVIQHLKKLPKPKSKNTFDGLIEIYSQSTSQYP